MVYVTGDTHGDFGRFSRRAKFDMTGNDTVIICGDFGGVWNGGGNDTYWLDWLEKKSFTICFVDGNHEGYDILESYPEIDFHGGRAHKIRDNIYHLIRGYIFDFEGKKYFAFGGARCHDICDGIFEPEDVNQIKVAYSMGYLFRVNHESWWEREMPNEEEMRRGVENLEKCNYCVDYVISHSLPTSVLENNSWIMVDERYDINNLTNYFDTILSNGLKYKKWYTGHYHMNMDIGDNMEIIYMDIKNIAE